MKLNPNPAVQQVFLLLRKNMRSLYFLSGLLLLSFLNSCTPSNPGGQELARQSLLKNKKFLFDYELLEPQIQAAANYIGRHTKPNGRFHYQTNLESTVRINQADYNELRHLGTIYALGQHAAYYPEMALRETMIKAGDYMRTCCMRPFPIQQDALAIWSFDEINNTGDSALVKLGANGLGVLAYLAINRIQAGYLPQDSLRALAETMIAMQLEDGAFESVYDAGLGDYAPITSLYYPGESILALLQLYREDPQDKWLDAALKALKYICLKRQGQDVARLPADHWILIATNELFSKVPPEKYTADRQLFLDHARRIVERIINDQMLDPEKPEIIGSYSGISSTTGVGARLEGLISVGPWVAESFPETEEKLLASIHYALQYMQGGVVTEGPLRGGITNLPRPLYELQERLAITDTQIQIDNVQHIMSAWMWAKDRKDWLWPN